MNYSIERAYEGIAKAGYRYTAYLGQHPGIRYHDYLEQPKEQVDVYRRSLESHGLKAVTAWGGNPIAYGLEGLLQRIDRAKELDLEYIILSSPYVGGKEADEVTSEELRDRFLRAVVPALPRLEEAGIRLDIKPHMGLYGTGAGLAALVSAVGHPLVGVSYDPGNIHYYEDKVATEDLPDVAHKVTSVCVKDHQKPPTEPRFPTPGRGDVDWPAVFSNLAKVNFQGYALIEVMTEDSAESLDQAAIETRQNLEAWIKAAGGEALL